MKPGSIDLYPNPATADRVSNYASELSTPLPQPILDYHARVAANHARAGYMISNLQGQYLTFLARSIGAKRVLEVGVYVGYSALVWAHAVGEDGKVTGLESSAEYTAMADEAIEKMGVKNIEVIQGDALETITTLKPEEPYDIIFLDAQKSGYPTYLERILAQSPLGATSGRLLRAGGLVVADNVLRRGLVADESDDNPWAVKVKEGGVPKSEYEGDRDLEYLREFNRDVSESERLESFLMPLFDGISLARLLD